MAVADRIAYTTNPAIDLDVLLSDAYTSNGARWSTPTPVASRVNAMEGSVQ
ncbi:MAG: hypothetical protein R2855_12555 [Thermomicrobiales bacterium]